MDSLRKYLACNIIITDGQSSRNSRLTVPFVELKILLFNDGLSTPNRSVINLQVINAKLLQIPVALSPECGGFQTKQLSGMVTSIALCIALLFMKLFNFSFGQCPFIKS
jgi:hypothetical protein